MNRQYTIAIVGGSLSTYGGGAPRSIAQQATTLYETGHHVELFVGYSKKYPLTQDQFSCKKCKVNASKLWGPSVLGLFPGALYRLWKTAKSFDFIHLNGAWNLTTFLGACISRHRNVPYVITMRGHFGEYHFHRKPLLKKILFRTLETSNIKHACAMHATAQWEVQTSRSPLSNAQQIVTIPNPVDLTDFQYPLNRTDARKSLNLKEADFHMVHLGRLAKQKNIPFLLEAFTKAHLGNSAFLTLVGPPEHTLKKELLKQIERLNIGSQVNFIDFAKGKERCNWLAAADLFVLPSFDENFCIVAVESVASGTHCLLSPNIGAIEFLPKRLIEVVQLEQKEWIACLRDHYKNRREQTLPDPEELHSFSSEHIGNDWMKFYQQIKSKTKNNKLIREK
ncbi:MAG: glycosyltransferase [Pontiella sp.]